MEISQVVGVRTRAQAALLAMEEATNSPQQRTTKRRKINKRKSSKNSPTILPEPEKEENSSGSISNEEFPASCCSSNGSVGFTEERIKSLDLEVESAQVETSTCNCVEDEIQRREMSRSSEFQGNSESMENDSHRQISYPKNMPTEFELDEFFSAAEKDIQKKFQQKYNYDIVKDVPLEGRYEWVELKP